MRPQKDEETIRKERLDVVISYLPALKRADIYFRAGRYFYCYKRGDEGIVIGIANKKRVEHKEISDFDGHWLRKKFHERYRRRKTILLQRNFK